MWFQVVLFYGIQRAKIVDANMQMVCFGVLNLLNDRKTLYVYFGILQMGTLMLPFVYGILYFFYFFVVDQNL